MLFVIILLLLFVIEGLICVNSTRKVKDVPF